MNAAEPLARIVYLTAPVGESELQFYKRKARERARRIGEPERVVANLRDTIAEMEAEG